MSWDESKPELHTCPCGNGVYAVVHLSDDWGRSEERWKMHCLDCKVQFGLYTYLQTRKGITETRHGWVREIFLQELSELNGRVANLKYKLATHLKTLYSERWRRHFQGKTKKTRVFVKECG